MIEDQHIEGIAFQPSEDKNEIGAAMSAKVFISGDSVVVRSGDEVTIYGF